MLSRDVLVPEGATARVPYGGIWVTSDTVTPPQRQRAPFGSCGAAIGGINDV